jgi:cytidyltransferase-like protein
VEFFKRVPGTPRTVAIFPGTFNPVTRAHLALAQSARARVDEVLFVLPRVFPHKEYGQVSFEERLRVLLPAAGDVYSVAATQRGLFIEIARECRDHYDAELWVLCGRDAAERIVNWDYGEPGAIERILEEFSLLVAARRGAYDPPQKLRHRIQMLETAEDLGDVSATEIRERITRGEPWEHLAVPGTEELIRPVYSRA